MKTFFKLTAAALLFCVLLSGFAYSETGYPWRQQLILESDAATVALDLAGGAFSDFHMKGSNLNPLSWNPPEKGKIKAQSLGHFICFDRWGGPHESEIKNGMSFHGEATQVVWDVLQKATKGAGGTSAVAHCSLPIAGLSLERKMQLSSKGAVMKVEEKITNDNKLGRIYNIVQHPSIAAPFLDETTVVDANAWKGFVQGDSWPDPAAYTIYWPETAYKGQFVDLRKLGANHAPDVTSFIFKDDVETGWVTACNAGKNLMIGYIWDLDEYPWLNIWRNAKEGKPAARGLEFGTTGLHRPFGDMVAASPIYNTPIYEYINTAETITKSYTVFLAEIPADFTGVGDVKAVNGRITVTEREGGNGHKIVINY